MLRVPGRHARPLSDRDRQEGRAQILLLARHVTGARAVRAAGLEPCRRSADRRQHGLFLGRHAVAVLQSRARPLPRRAGDGARAGRESRVRHATTVRAAGRATSRAPAPCSTKRSSASTSCCRASTTKRRCGAMPVPKRRSRGCRRSASRRSWSRTVANPALVASKGAPEFVPVPEIVKPVDTTAAGDSFSAGYIAARLSGEAPSARCRPRTATGRRCGEPSRRHRAARAAAMH